MGQLEEERSPALPHSLYKLMVYCCVVCRLHHVTSVCVPALMLGESRTVKRHRRRYFKVTSSKRKYCGPVARRLREKVNNEVMPFTRDNNYYGRALRFIDEFEVYTRRMLVYEAGWTGKKAALQSAQELLGDEEMLELYIQSLTSTGEEGACVPGEARRYLSAARVRLGMSSIVKKD